MSETLANWPLVVGVYRTALDLDGYQTQLDVWERWFARQERFALLRIYTTPESLSHPDGSAPLAKAWLQRNRPVLQRWVMGMATVVPASNYEKMKRFQVDKAFGVPGAIFREAEEALGWLQDTIFSPAGIAFKKPLLSALQ